MNYSIKNQKNMNMEKKIWWCSREGTSGTETSKNKSLRFAFEHLHEEQRKRNFNNDGILLSVSLRWSLAIESSVGPLFQFVYFCIIINSLVWTKHHRGVYPRDDSDVILRRLLTRLLTSRWRWRFEDCSTNVAQAAHQITMGTDHWHKWTFCLVKLDYNQSTIDWQATWRQ